MTNQGVRMSTASAAIVLIIILCFIFWRQLIRPTPRLTDSDVTKEMALRADQAVAAAKEKGIVLDYSPESVEKVEEILAVSHEKYQRNLLSDSDLVKESLKWGAYIGEVAKKIRKYRWALDSKIGGDGSFPIVGDKSESFPVRWCYKRIKNGEEDNIWHKFTFSILNPEMLSIEQGTRETQNDDNEK
jgi:hypothetical protein